MMNLSVKFRAKGLKFRVKFEKFKKIKNLNFFLQIFEFSP